MVHNLAQISHCAAQGKVGSGFDVAAAVYGSHCYVRFDPLPLRALLDVFDTSVPDLSPILTGHWDNTHTALGLPAGMRLVLGDVNIGSNTPALVRKVLEWRSSQDPMVQEVWDGLNCANKKIGEHLSALHQLEKEDKHEFTAHVSHCAELLPLQWEAESKVGKVLHDLREVFHTGVRHGLRRMGSLAGVPLEPPEQTQLADATMDVKGCLIAGVPGAGGYDAIFAIALSPAALTRIESLWEGWKQMQVLPLILREDPVGVTLEKVSPQGLDNK